MIINHQRRIFVYSVVEQIPGILYNVVEMFKWNQLGSMIFQLSELKKLYFEQSQSFFVKLGTFNANWVIFVNLDFFIEDQYSLANAYQIFNRLKE